MQLPDLPRGTEGHTAVSGGGEQNLPRRCRARARVVAQHEHGDGSVARHLQRPDAQGAFSMPAGDDGPEPGPAVIIGTKDVGNPTRVVPSRRVFAVCRRQVDTPGESARAVIDSEPFMVAMPS